ncbi:MAG: thermonuclease family protein [Acidobacteriota bacterium]|nr:thermonuclease family protein [Acidobacteriota bacterium]
MRNHLRPICLPAHLTLCSGPWIVLTLLAVACAAADRSVPGRKTCRVEKVLDGDTIVCAGGQTIRYAGIDTPEVFQAFAERARQTNRTWVLRQTVEYDEVERDHYGRIIALVYRKDWGPPSVGERLLAEGLAWVYDHEDVRRDWDRLLETQRRAMRAGRGLWGGLSREPATFIGNARTRRFHTAQCVMADRIQPRYRRTFASLWEAFWEGYAPARECAAYVRLIPLRR